MEATILRGWAGLRHAPAHGPSAKVGLGSATRASRVARMKILSTATGSGGMYWVSDEYSEAHFHIESEG